MLIRSNAAIDVADELPSATVIGTDISAIQPTWVPPNCSFYIEDAETEWLFDESFDFIHGRALCGSIADWPKFFGQVKETLKPGGWVEMQDYVSWIKSDDETIKRGKWTLEWVNEINRGTEMFGKSLNVVHKYAEWMKEAGFVEIRDEIVKVWPPTDFGHPLLISSRYLWDRGQRTKNSKRWVI